MANSINLEPKRPAYVGLGVIGAFLLFLAVWGFTAPVSGAAIAEGSLQVRSQRQSVQHPDGGVVARLNVVEGQEVRQGQVLIELADQEPLAKLNVLKAERWALLAQEGRLIAERDEATEPTFVPLLTNSPDEPTVTQTMANERALMVARRRQFEAQSGMLQAKISQLTEQATGARVQADGLKRQSDLIEEEAQGARQLLASGYTPKTRVLALERSAAQLDADRGAKQADAAAAEQAISETNLNIAKIERERVSEITTQLKQTQASLAEIGPKIDAATDVLSRTKIVAPSSGFVVGLSAFTVGGVVAAGTKIMDVVPTGEPLIVDARLQLTNIGDVKRNQPADVRLTSVPRNERPRLRGEIINVSADKLSDERTGKGFYSVRVQLDPDDIRNAGITLQPGMPTEVVVTTRARTLVGYLIGPLADEISGAFREK